jgi:hypothetical protein
VKLLDGAFCHTAIVVVHECKAARAAGLTIGGDYDLHGVANGAEVLADVYFGRAVRKVPDE